MTTDDNCNQYILCPSLVIYIVRGGRLGDVAVQTLERGLKLQMDCPTTNLNDTAPDFSWCAQNIYPDVHCSLFCRYNAPCGQQWKPSWRRSPLAKHCQPRDSDRIVPIPSRNDHTFHSSQLSPGANNAWEVAGRNKSRIILSWEPSIVLLTSVSSYLFSFVFNSCFISWDTNFVHHYIRSMTL